MRRRLTLAILAVVAGALAFAGLGSVLLVQRAITRNAQTQVTQQATAIAGAAPNVILRGRTAATDQRLLTLLRDVGRVENVTILRVTPSGALVTGAQAPLPSGVTPADVDTTALLAGDTVSGVRNHLAWAAAPATLPAADLLTNPAQRARATGVDVTFAVIVTAPAHGVTVGGWYFAVAAAVALAVAALVGDVVARRVRRPLASAEQAARRVASGDLSGRVQVGPRDYPEVASLAASFNTMADSLARSRGLERQFLMSVSHDLRTPLTSIRGWAEAIADGAADDRRAAAVIGGEARRLERLVADLLDLAKLDARSFSLDVRPVDVAEVVADAAEGQRPLLEEAGITLHVDGPREPVMASADPDRLAQVVANLVENAYKFAAGRVTVSVARTPAGVSVAVADDGPGIGAADLPHVFDRLYQSERTAARTAGSGLGLAIVRELAVAMGGSVRAEPVTQGSRLVVDLPAVATPRRQERPTPGRSHPRTPAP